MPRPRSTAIFQPRPGLGDLIWHLPLIRALAAPGAAVLITKPSTQADTLLANDPAIARIVWFDRNPRQGRGVHDGPLGFPRLVRTLRNIGADRCILLHHSASLAAAMCLAGIPKRAGYGYAAGQRAWLNSGPTLSGPVRHAEAAEQAAAYALACGLTNLPEPSVIVNPDARARMRTRLAHAPRPWLVLGIGAHGANRQWGADRFGAVASAWLARTAGSVLPLATAQEARLSQAATIGLDPVRCTPATGWPLAEVTALLAEAEAFVGNDSGPMNLRAAVGRPAVALFGASGPLTHSRFIVPVVPEGGARAGMAGISEAAVLAALGGW